MERQYEFTNKCISGCKETALGLENMIQPEKNEVKVLHGSVLGPLLLRINALQTKNSLRVLKVADASRKKLKRHFCTNSQLYTKLILYRVTFLQSYFCAKGNFIT